ncbi:MAG: radical SAM protein [Candidatus Omnitrophica bacterium]|nr:radical SAM protein [Candidatus Omnitrophota bacterium]
MNHSQEKNHFQYLYGPVSSWRLGISMGIDPLSQKEKNCTFGCVYCQLGERGVFTDERRVFVPTHAILDEVKRLPKLEIDTFTFSGRGEPTLAKNLGEMIQGIRNIRQEKIAVITNSSLIHRVDVQNDLLGADLVLAKLDAPTQELFNRINRQMPQIQLDAILSGLKQFRKKFTKKLALQIMFIQENQPFASEMAMLAKTLQVDEIQINTPLRPSGVRPLGQDDIEAIKKTFQSLCDTRTVILSVYDVEKKNVAAVEDGETLRRRGKS